MVLVLLMKLLHIKGIVIVLKLIEICAQILMNFSCQLRSDSSQETFGPTNGGSDDETESLLKLPKVPFANDLDVKSGRSSVISQVLHAD